MAQTTSPVSLEPHLRLRLERVLPLVPNENEVFAQIQKALQGSEEISHQTLHLLSKWVRTDEGFGRLRDAGVDQSEYALIPLLAGTRTSPSIHFPSSNAIDPQLEAQREKHDKRAVVVISNGVLSVLGSGFAAWWVAGNLGWRDEWSALLAVLMGSVVAISEIILFMIWDSRRHSKSKRMASLRKTRFNKKHDFPNEVMIVTAEDKGHETLRHREVVSKDDFEHAVIK